MGNDDFQKQMLGNYLILKKYGKTTVTLKDLKKIGIIIPVPEELEPETIQKIRKKVGYSQAVFANTLNVSSETVKHWEHGKRKPSGIALKVLRMLYNKPELINEFV